MSRKMINEHLMDWSNYKKILEEQLAIETDVTQIGYLNARKESVESLILKSRNDKPDVNQYA